MRCTNVAGAASLSGMPAAVRARAWAIRAPCFKVPFTPVSFTNRFRGEWVTRQPLSVGFEAKEVPRN
jgi:hypothetical protein